MLKLLKARILKALYLTPLDFLNAYIFRLKVDKKLVKTWKFIYYLSQSHKLLILILIIKPKKKSASKPITLTFLLLPFKEIKGLNIKVLCILFLFKNKIPKIKKEDLEFNNFIFLTLYKNIGLEKLLIFF